MAALLMYIAVVSVAPDPSVCTSYEMVSGSAIDHSSGYGAGEVKCWRIPCSGGYVSLTWNTFETEDSEHCYDIGGCSSGCPGCNCDYVIIYTTAGNSERMCGTSLPSYTIADVGDVVIHFKSDNLKHRAGFSLGFTCSVTAPTDPHTAIKAATSVDADCHHSYTDLTLTPASTLSVPASGTYKPGLSQCYRVACSHQLQLTWNRFDIEGGASCPNDKVVLYTTSGKTDHCGSMSPSLTPPMGSDVVLLMESDGATELTGFEVIFECLTPAPDTPAPDTPAPDTPAPDTPAPDTPAPDTPAPDTPAPDTPAPDTPAPDTPAPDTPAPDTPAPDTPAPDTPAPDTPAPDTPAPDTPAPDTPAPDTPAPDTPAPDTPAPDTPAPDTPAPDTSAPDTPAPDTPAPDTPAPDTPAPDTPAPDTTAPDTPAPDTPAPDTPSPDTLVPDTPAPDTPAPDTLVPDTTAPDTPAPDTPVPSTPSPDTPAPATFAPQTSAPTAVPTTAPVKVSPDTPAPVTSVPDTLSPSTSAPSTELTSQATQSPPSTAPDTATPLVTLMPATPVPAVLSKGEKKTIEGTNAATGITTVVASASLSTMSTGGAALGKGSARAVRSSLYLSMLDCPNTGLVETDRALSPLGISIGDGDLQELRGMLVGNFIIISTFGVVMLCVGWYMAFKGAGFDIVMCRLPAATFFILLEFLWGGTAEGAAAVIIYDDRFRVMGLIVAMCGLGCLGWLVYIVREVKHIARMKPTYVTGTWRWVRAAYVWEATTEENEAKVGWQSAVFDCYKSQHCGYFVIQLSLMSVAAVLGAWNPQTTLSCASRAGVMTGVAGCWLSYLVVAHPYVRPLENFVEVVVAAFEFTYITMVLAAITKQDVELQDTAASMGFALVMANAAKFLFDILFLLFDVFHSRRVHGTFKGRPLVMCNPPYGCYQCYHLKQTGFENDSAVTLLPIPHASSENCDSSSRSCVLTAKKPLKIFYL